MCAQHSPVPWLDLERLLTETDLYDCVVEEIDGRRIRIGDRWLVDFASCNYLGFDLIPEIMDRVGIEIRRWGTHPSWSRLLGNPRLYIDIEDQLTELLGAPDTLALPTITHIHSAVIPVLSQGGHLYLESGSHRTIFDACRIAQGLGTRLHHFRAGDWQGLDDALRTTTGPGPRLVCLDGVNSMTGNLPELGVALGVTRAHGATLYVDDAHGFGVIGERSKAELCAYGSRGNGIVRHLGEDYDDLVLVAGFSKAYSSLLAFLALPTALKTRLKVAAAPYLYSGPSPTASLATVLAGFEVNAVRGDALRLELFQLTARLLAGARALGVRTLNASGLPIVEFPTAVDADLARVGAFLQAEGIYTTVAAYPLVARANTGFRVQVTAANTVEEIDLLLAVLAKLADQGWMRLEDGDLRPGLV